MTTPPELMTPTEVGRLFKVDHRTVSRWARNGRIGSVKTPGGHTRLFRAEVMALLEAEPLNDIEATGHCCCAGCIGMGPCDDDLGKSDPDDRDSDFCSFCWSADCVGGCYG
ncbi:helix-turn-helix domain-containing protein [Catelliglobosispora koreensis]|uniref:helix-turn-helix domain-containing protein n=1 Tax=Catelliglobosispora koreensis TaxID=129052 RepID=UPI000378C941|nr:helix-turn-helix domain-containing protein [Catelliglobosispora koreensis]